MTNEPKFPDYGKDKTRRYIQINTPEECPYRDLANFECKHPKVVIPKSQQPYLKCSSESHFPKECPLTIKMSNARILVYITHLERDAAAMRFKGRYNDFIRLYHDIQALRWVIFE